MANTQEVTLVQKDAPEVKINPIAEAYQLTKLAEKYKTKSAIIRFLTSEGHTRSNIAKFMNIRYQHVRNVQVQDA